MQLRDSTKPESLVFNTYSNPQMIKSKLVRGMLKYEILIYYNIL